MGQFYTEPDLNEILKDMKARVQALATTQAIRTYTTATLPSSANLPGPVIVYVSDAAAGSRFQGWDVTAAAWVPLG